MLETILNNFHLEKILWILQKRIAYIMILGYWEEWQEALMHI